MRPQPPTTAHMAVPCDSWVTLAQAVIKIAAAQHKSTKEVNLNFLLHESLLNQVNNRNKLCSDSGAALCLHQFNEQLHKPFLFIGI